MPWKASIVKRLVARNHRENDPMYERLFSMIDKYKRMADLSARQMSNSGNNNNNNNNNNNGDSRDRQLYQAATVELYECQQRNKELQTSIDYLNAQVEAKSAEIESLKNELEQEKKVSTDTKRALAAALSEKEVLERDVGKLTSELEERKATVAELEATLEKLRLEFTEMKAGHEVALAEASAVRDTLTSFQNKLVDQMMESSRLKSMNERLLREMNQSRSANGSCEPSREPSPTRGTISRSNSTAQPLTPADPAGNSGNSNSNANSGGSVSIVKGLAKFTSFLRSQNLASSFDFEAKSTKSDINDEFQIVTLPEIAISCSYPTKVVHEFDAHEGECTAVKWSPTSKYLATAGTDRQVKLWSPENIISPASLAASIVGPPMGVLSLEFDLSELHVAAACADNTARIWRIISKKEHILVGHTDYVTAVRFGASDNSVTTCSHDRTIRMWDSSSWSYVTRTIMVGSRCNDVVLLTGGGLTMASGHSNRKVLLWDYRAEMSRPLGEIALSEKVTSLDANISRCQILALTRDHTLHLIDYRMNKILLSFDQEGFIVNSDYARAVFSPDGQFACAGSMVGSKVGSLYVWNTTTGQNVSTINKTDSTPVIAASWQPSGRYVATIEKKRRCTLWSDM